MPRRLLKRYLPEPEALCQHKHLSCLGKRLSDPNLWHLNRRSVALAAAVGMFVAFIPAPMQMLLSGLAAIWLRVNLAIAVAMVWLTNPITMPPIFYCNYLLGAWALGHTNQMRPFEFSMTWVLQELERLWQPFLLGSLLMGLLLAVVTYFTVHVLWRWSIVRRRQQRQGLVSRP